MTLNCYAACSNSLSYWHASQSGLSIEQANGTGAAWENARSASLAEEELSKLDSELFTEDATVGVFELTAFNAPVFVVDFSADVALKARR